MSTITYGQPIRSQGAVMQRATNLNEVVRRVRALRALSEATGFSTNRTVGQLLERLSEDELVQVGEKFILDPEAQR